MQRHLHVVARPRPEHQRPAKVVQLEARREARIDAARAYVPRPPHRPAA
jgi:hypothetical protein